MMIVIRIIAALVLIVGADLVHGAWTNRWRTSPALASFAAKLDFVPMDIGPWKGTAVDFSPRELAVVRETAGTAIDPKGDPANDFLKLFIPELDRIVFTGPT
jgi:hypothetical protein